MKYDIPRQPAAILNDKQQSLYQEIVNAPFANKYKVTSLDLGIVVLLLVNPETQTIDRIALSNTEHAKGALRMSEKKFHEIKIPLKNKTNIIPIAINGGKPQHTDDWYFLFTPELNAKSARFNQTGAGIACSFVYPFDALHGGALIFSYFQPFMKITPAHKRFMSQHTKWTNQLLLNS